MDKHELIQRGEAAHLRRVNDHYDNRLYAPLHRAFYGGSEYANYGYRDDPATPAVRASEALLDRLLAWIPDTHGSILDVGCGKGAACAYVRAHHPRRRVVGINVSEKQLGTCRQVAPEARFVAMDAARLGFRDAAFNDILCVESAFHFKNRLAFLREARRVLVSGGRLVLSDILFAPGVLPPDWLVPPENEVVGPRGYRVVCRLAGFSEVEVVDATVPCWQRHREYLAAFSLEQVRAGVLSPGERAALMRQPRALARAITHYLLVRCVK